MINKETVFPAILYQAAPAPALDGIVKPMKLNGYADSGADIGYALLQTGIKVVCPVADPVVATDLNWVFPDTSEGIRHALSKGASVLWLNTVLYTGHPVEEFLAKGVALVGQDPATADTYDNKWTTAVLLRNNRVPVPDAVLINEPSVDNLPFPFPFVLKPLRGRGSVGVKVIRDVESFHSALSGMLTDGQYGPAVYAEPFLPGEEITVTVMPPGEYMIFDELVLKASHWCLTAVKRFNHHDGVAPYNGTVAVVHNSRVVSSKEHESHAIRSTYEHCAKAAELIKAKAPVRIDCRQDSNGNYILFDLNLKPNMTGHSRPHRFDQDSLVALAAADLGWNFNDLLVNILNQRWKKG